MPIQPSVHGRAFRRAGSIVTTFLLTLFFVGLTAIPALAAVTCNAAGGATLTVTLGAGDAVTVTMDGTGDIAVTPSGDGDCANHVDATVTLIEIDGSTGNEAITINNAGGTAFNADDDFNIDGAA
ncbi:MAG: hypothetical protein ACXWWX_01915, partial [Actinomycetota bacterium]